MSRFFLLLALTLTFILAGCSEDNPTDTGGDSQNSFRVNGNGYDNVLIETTIDGVSSFAAEETDGQSKLGTVLMQGIVNGDLFTISLVVDDIKSGQYTISQTEGVGLSLNVIKATNQTQPEIYFSNGGTVTIDEWGGPGGDARGSFDVTAVITPAMDKQISISGSFNLSPIRE